MKKFRRSFSVLLALIMTVSINCLNVLAEEPNTIRDMTYEEWLIEQENATDCTSNEDLQPVIISTSAAAEASHQTYSGEQCVGNRLLENIIAEKGEYRLDSTINMELLSESNCGNIVETTEMARTAPTANLIPYISNPDSLVNGQISTDTIIVFLFDDIDSDEDTIVGRYVDGSATEYILGGIDGGFVMQITNPGTYQLFYQVEDSAGEFSRVISFSIDVVAAEEFQVFEGSFNSAEDTAIYNFAVDFSEMDSVAVCLVRKGYVGSRIEVLDENGNQVLLRGTNSRQAKNWGFIDRPSNDATICNYSVVVTPVSYENRASDYRIIIGDKKDTERMMSGIENTVLLEQYYESQVNLQNSAYVPNVGEYWYKYRRESTSVITILSSVYDIRFKILDADTLEPLYDSANFSNTHKTSFTGNGSWICAEKARLTTVVGTEYYLVVYSTSPNEGLSLRTGSMATAVGNPVMCGGSTTISPNSSIRISSSSFSSSLTFNISGANLPETAKVRQVSLSGVRMSNVDRWRAKAPNYSLWKNNSSSFNPAIDMNYINDSSNNIDLKGNWSASFKASSSGNGVTITPSFYFTYYYEYGDL